MNYDAMRLYRALRAHGIAPTRARIVCMIERDLRRREVRMEGTGWNAGR